MRFDVRNSLGETVLILEAASLTDATAWAIRNGLPPSWIVEVSDAEVLGAAQWRLKEAFRLIDHGPSGERDRHGDVPIVQVPHQEMLPARAVEAAARPAGELRVEPTRNSRLVELREITPAPAGVTVREMMATARAAIAAERRGA